jgi:3-hydroxyisobutyrate dehydrogenase-like beta-hydroxyacid dehydrogenase
VAKLAPFGISAEIVSREVGTAAATKMFRSIIVKGLEALITECVLGASRYNADERVFASLDKSFPGVDWKQLADYMVGRVVVHGERRAREMEEVAATLREIDIEPIMAEAIVRRMDWSVEAGLKKHFGGEAPKSYREVVALI